MEIDLQEAIAQLGGTGLHGALCSISTQRIIKVKDHSEKERLVKYYNITASAKYTLEPREDFITHIIREFVKIAIK